MKNSRHENTYNTHLLDVLRSRMPGWDIEALRADGISSTPRQIAGVLLERYASLVVLLNVLLRAEEADISLSTVTKT